MSDTFIAMFEMDNLINNEPMEEHKETHKDGNLCLLFNDKSRIVITHGFVRAIRADGEAWDTIGNQEVFRRYKR